MKENSRGEGGQQLLQRGRVYALLGKGNLNTEGEGRVKGWGGIEVRLCGVVTQGVKGENWRLVE